MESLNIPTFVLGFNPEDEDSGIYAVSIVDEPAIGYGYQKFNKQENFQIVNEDKQILTGAILLADTPIYRNNADVGEHYVIFNKETIRGMMQKFFKKNNHFNSNLNHEEKAKINDVYFYESYMVDRERGINPPNGYEDVPDGSWFGTMKIEDTELWNKVKDGSFRGFSVEGLFSYDGIQKATTNKYSELLAEIDEIEQMLNKL